jgi:hypothetical protein
MARLYVEVRSGLGNQLFQFAFAYLLAREFQRELVVCPSYFDPFLKYHVKKFLGREFRTFRLPLVVSQSVQILKDAEAQKLIGDKKVLVIREGDDSIERMRTVLSENTDIYLRGYWQYPDFFLSHVAELRGLFKPSFQLSKKCAAMLQSLDERHVGIHVRRGDFFTNRSFGACSVQYYVDAIEEIRREVDQPRFIVFTNDKSWVAKNFPSGINMQIYGNDRERNTDIEEYFMMTRMKSLIISNSTFSWWGGLLNDVNEPNIICPEVWFRKKEMQDEAKRFILPHWHAIPNALELISDQHTSLKV